jgi:hypothetical protein
MVLEKLSFVIILDDFWLVEMSITLLWEAESRDLIVIR